MVYARTQKEVIISTTRCNVATLFVPWRALGTRQHVCRTYAHVTGYTHVSEASISTSLIFDQYVRGLYVSVCITLSV
jgi:hypothetical protein